MDEKRRIVFLIWCQMSEEMWINSMLRLEKWKRNLNFPGQFDAGRIFLCVKALFESLGEIVILPEDDFSVSPSLRHRECGVGGRGTTGGGFLETCSHASLHCEKAKSYTVPKMQKILDRPSVHWFLGIMRGASKFSRDSGAFARRCCWNHWITPVKNLGRLQKNLDKGAEHLYTIGA